MFFLHFTSRYFILHSMDKIVFFSCHCKKSKLRPYFSFWPLWSPLTTLSRNTQNVTIDENFPASSRLYSKALASEWIDLLSDEKTEYLLPTEPDDDQEDARNEPKLASTLEPNFLEQNNFFWKSLMQQVKSTLYCVQSVRSNYKADKESDGRSFDGRVVAFSGAN